MSIKLKITLLTTASCALLLCIVMGNIYYQEKVVSSQVDQELEALMLNHTKNVVQNINTQLIGLHDVLKIEVSNGLNVARDVMANSGNVELDYHDNVTWDAINQYTKDVKKVRIPKMMVGGEWLGMNNLLTEVSPVVDKTKRLVGGTATIFQRINESGDMLRVCTNVEKLDKTRAIGTYIPAINPDGSANPVVSTLMSGKTYNGRAYVVNAWYLTSYEPIYDEEKQIIGALYFGIMQEKTDVLRKGIKNTVLGKSGFLYVLDRKGNYIIAKKGQKAGKNIWEDRDMDGSKYIQEIIGKGLDLESNEVAFQKYKIIESENAEPQTKVSAVAFFKPWDWIIVSDAYENDFKATKFKMQKSIGDMVKWGGIIGFVFMILILLAALLVSDKITNPITRLTEAANEISQGNLEREINITSKDETGQLAEAFERMQSSLIIATKRSKRN